MTPSTIRPRPRALVACAVAASAAALLPGAASATGGSRLVVYVPPSEPAYVDLGAPGRGPGDQFVFSGDVHRNRTQGPLGSTYGTMTVVRVDAGGEEVRMLQQVFELGEDDTVVVVGPNRAVLPDLQLRPNRPVVRAVVGGTGRYAGIKGQVRVTRLPDGWYRHEFRF